MKISVIIPTRGRDACLRTTLDDLTLQDYQDFDVWVVDQNDVPLKDLAAHLSSHQLHHETIPPKGSHAGRNLAIKKTDAALCVFIDDDVRIKKDFLTQHAKAHIDGAPKRIAAIAGRVIQPLDGLSDEQMRKMGSPARYNRLFGYVSGNFVGRQAAYVEHIHECNFSATTASLRAVDGFNENFQGNAYFEGADLALRFIEKGFSIYYSPEIALVHLQEPSGGNRIQQKSTHTYWYLRNYALLNSKHMHPIGVPLFFLRSAAYVFAKAIKNRDVSVFTQGFLGLFDGLRYFSKLK